MRRKERERALVDLFAAMDNPSGPAYECNYYPCHFEGQDCSLCFCPFYPCLIYRLGGELVISSTGNYVWSCKNCWWVHVRENVEEIVTYFSAYPRQILVESDWYFFSRSLQEILFGEELGNRIGEAYNLMPANFCGFDCVDIETGEFLDVVVDDFRVVSIRRISKLEDAKGIAIPEKSGNTLIGLSDDGFVKCSL